MRGPHFEPGPEFFDSLAGSPAGAERRLLRIGPFRIQMEDLPSSLIPSLSDYFLGFLGAEPAGEGLRLPVRRAGVPCFIDPYRSIERSCVQRPIDGRIFVYGHHFGGWFDPAGDSGLLAVCRLGWPGMKMPLEIFLRVYCAWRAIDSGGFLLHAASILRGGRVYVFFGHSGAGKTTVSRLSQDSGSILSDDITLVTREAKGYLAHSVPLRGPTRERVVSERRTYPVAGLYHLVQSRRNRVGPLPRAKAVAAVLSCMPFVTDRALPRDPAQTMAHLESVLESLPVFRLEFTRSADFWDPVLQSVL